jgi:hypothetical protein
VDVLIRYELPPAWELLEGGVVKQGEYLWVLPEDDDELVKVLKATSAPFFQRTGEFAKVSFFFFNYFSLNPQRLIVNTN